MKLPGRKVYIFLLFVLVAAFVWVLHALSRPAQDSFVFTLKYTNPVYSETGALQKKVTATIAGRGYDLLYVKWNYPSPEIVIDFNRIKPTGKESKVDYKKLITEQYPELLNHVSIMSVTPESFYLGAE
ncbi:MAG: hypothetical protein IPO27_00805 [Bacteroidetes bacterium]|nr:hypothetical protein [Bacteroidota bacterium]